MSAQEALPELSESMRWVQELGVGAVFCSNHCSGGPEAHRVFMTCHDGGGLMVLHCQKWSASNLDAIRNYPVESFTVLLDPRPAIRTA